jgi:hypothetical protein
MKFTKLTKNKTANFMLTKSFDMIWKMIVLLAIASLLIWLIIPKVNLTLGFLMLS